MQSNLSLLYKPPGRTPSHRMRSPLFHAPIDSSLLSISLSINMLLFQLKEEGESKLEEDTAASEGGAAIFEEGDSIFEEEGSISEGFPLIGFSERNATGYRGKR